MRHQILHSDDRGVWGAAQERMVQEQLVGPGRELTHPGMLGAMRKVPRHEFVPAAQRARAWEDCALPIGFGQTISQPFIVGLMTEQLNPQPTDRILEVGTGSGYQAAVLAGLVQEVYTIEIVDPLARRAQADLNRLGYSNVFVRSGDGYQGWPEAAPFDAIIVTCAPERVPQPLIDQIQAGGRLIIPVGPQGEQQLILLQKRQGRLECLPVLAVRFVPMTGQAQAG
jgi:protein-L-isoaspartate(D-aspartate) O-methyltransferase